MEEPSPWTQAALAAGRTALGASLFPLAAVVAYGVGRTYGAAMAVVVPGLALLSVAALATVVLTIAGGRRAWNGSASALGLLAASLASLFGQVVLAAVLAVALTGSMRHSRGSLPRHRSAPVRSTP